MAANNLALRTKSVAAIAAFAVLSLLATAGGTGAPANRAKPRSQNVAAPKYEFDVVSIKIVGPNDIPSNTPSGFSPEGLSANRARLWWLFRMAYDMPMSQIVGMPGWVNDTRYMIDARLDPDTAAALQKLSPDQLRIARQQMLRAMMADRFALKFHTETRELPAYFLTVAKDGPKLQEARPDHVGKFDMPDINGQRATDFVQISGGRQATLVGQAASMTTLAAYLSQWALSSAGENARPVLDRTGLSGRYDFEVPFAEQVLIFEAPPAGAPAGTPATATTDFTSGPSLFKALQDTLGLKMESGKGPVPVIVIDHVEKPSAN